MDIKIEKKKGWRALLQMKNIPYALGGVFLVFVVWLLLRDKASTLRVDADVVTVSEVEAGEFNDYVRLTGTVQPITTVQLSPLESGVVERIVAEEGSKVKKGDVIIEMSNNSLSMQILQSEADLAEKQNILRNTLISMEQERLSLRQEQLQLDIDVERKRRDYERKERLYKNELLSQEEWLQAKEDYELALNKRQLNVEKQRQDSLFRSNQVGQMEESLHSMTLNMQLIRERVDNLKVKAPIDGEVGMLDIVLGQSVGQGTAIGQVNDLSAYKVTDDGSDGLVRASGDAFRDASAQGLSRGARGSVQGRLRIHGRRSGEYPQRPDLLSQPAAGTAHRVDLHSARLVLPVDGRLVDICSGCLGREGTPPPDTHRPPEPAVLRGCGGSRRGRARDHLVV